MRYEETEEETWKHVLHAAQVHLHFCSMFLARPI